MKTIYWKNCGECGSLIFAYDIIDFLKFSKDHKVRCGWWEGGKNENRY